MSNKNLVLGTMFFVLLMGFVLPKNVFAGDISCIYTTDANRDTSQGCLLSYYKNTNSHIALCSQGSIAAPNAIKCYILADDGTQFPIEFTDNASLCPTGGEILYVYKPTNSHVSLTSGLANKICISNKFYNVVGWGTSTPSGFNYSWVLNLYNTSNSHISVSQTSGTIPFYLYVKDTIYPETNITYPPNGTVIIESSYIEIYDSDNAGFYKCFYKVENETEFGTKPWIERTCGFYRFLLNTLSEGCTGICYVWSKVIDLGGNVRTIYNEYLAPLISIEFYTSLPDTVIFEIGRGRLEIPVFIRNSGTVDLENVNITAKLTSLTEGSYGRLDLGDCPTIQRVPAGIVESCTMYFYPYKLGNFLIDVYLTGNVTVGTNTNVIQRSFNIKVGVVSSLEFQGILASDEALLLGMVSIVAMVLYLYFLV